MKFFFSHKKDKNSDVALSSAVQSTGEAAQLDAQVPSRVASPPQEAHAASFRISPSPRIASNIVSPSPFQSQVERATEVRSPANIVGQPQASERVESPPKNTSGAASPPLRPLPPHVFPPKGPMPPGVKLMKGPPPPGMMKKMLVPAIPPGMMAFGSMSQHMKHPGLMKVPHALGGAPPPNMQPLPQQQQQPWKAMPYPLQPHYLQQANTSITSHPRSGSPKQGELSRFMGSFAQEKRRSLPPQQEGTGEKSFVLPAASPVKKMDNDSPLRLDAPRSVIDDDDSDIQFVVESDSDDDDDADDATPIFEEEVGEKASRSNSKAASSLQTVLEGSKKNATSLSLKNDKIETQEKPKGSGSSGGSLAASSGPGELGHPAMDGREGRHTSKMAENDYMDSPRFNTQKSSSEVAFFVKDWPETPKHRNNGGSAQTSSISPLILEFTENGKGEGYCIGPQDGVGNRGNRGTTTRQMESKLASSVRSRIAEQFLSILCPQQFYGRVVKLHHIRLVKADPNQAPGIKEYNTIFVATKGLLPNQYFYPLLRLNASDGLAASDGNPQGCVDTPIVLCEAAPGNMLFTETELESKHLFAVNETSTSCFVVEKSAIVFREPLKYVLPIAMLTVRWIPFSVAHSEPQCPVHHKELQLFDRCTRELLCALCVSRKGGNTSDLVIIPDLCSGDSRHQIMETLVQKLQEGQQTTSRWVKQHQRIASIARHKKDAINQQFDLLLAAIKSKREEFLENCDARFGLALSTVAKELLMTDEKVSMLKAAIEHLRTESSKPLYSMQVATIANALHSCGDFPESFSLDSLNIPSLTAELTPNLEGAMTEVQSVYPRATNTTLQWRRPRSPFGLMDVDGHRHVEQQQEEIQDEQDPVPLSNLLQKPRSEQRDARGKSRSQQRNLDRAVSTLRCPVGSSRSPQKRSMPLVPVYVDNSVYGINSNSKLDQRERGNKWVALPGCRGTCLFDAPLQELLLGVDDVRIAHSKPRCLQWTLRVDDPGDWVGIGVGVGSNLQTRTTSRTPDLSHLWVVTGSDTRHIFTLRVTVQSSVSHAKLSIHDGKGKRIDDGRIPQWNAARICYPQITFGGRIGEVHLVEPPHLLPR